MQSIRPPSGHFAVLYFAAASSYVKKSPGGHDFFQAPLPVHRLYATLEEKYPGIEEKILASCLLNIDEEYVDLDDDLTKNMVIQEGSIAVIVPPVSAG